MNDLGPAAALGEIGGPLGAEKFAQLRQAMKPMVIRGQVSDWPLVTSARQADEAIVSYLMREPATRPVGAIAAAPEEHGRFFYNAEVTGFNFHFGRGKLEVFLSDLLKARDVDDPPALAVQSEDIEDLLPHIAAENRLELLPHVRPRIWIGNRIHVAPHYDLKENVACCVAGRRRFTLFPPDQTPNLYPGPLELTPAGTPVSMVNPAAPELDRFPRFVEAWQHASSAVLEPGDAIYIPYGWWHGVDSLEPVSILVNYWWTDDAHSLQGTPHDVLLHALLALRHLPHEQRAMWRDRLDYYIFETYGDPAEHLPGEAKGVPWPAKRSAFRPHPQYAAARDWLIADGDLRAHPLGIRGCKGERGPHFFLEDAILILCRRPTHRSGLWHNAAGKAERGGQGLQFLRKQRSFLAKRYSAPACELVQPIGELQRQVKGAEHACGGRRCIMKRQGVTDTLHHQRGAPIVFGPFAGLNVTAGQQLQKKVDLAMREVQIEVSKWFEPCDSIADGDYIAQPALARASRFQRETGQWSGAQSGKRSAFGYAFGPAEHDMQSVTTADFG